MSIYMFANKVTENTRPVFFKKEIMIFVIFISKKGSKMLIDTKTCVLFCLWSSAHPSRTLGTLYHDTISHGIYLSQVIISHSFKLIL